MPVFDLFSKRQKRLRGEMPDVFTYTEIPRELRIQVIHIWKDAIGEPWDYNQPALNLYRGICDILRREYGTLTLVGTYVGRPFEELGQFLVECEDHERVLDVIELSFRMIDEITRDFDYRHHVSPRIEPDDAINELNARFLEHGVGYQYESGVLIRKDSEVLHSEVVRPTLQLLSDKRYSGANEEFLKAHEHYRHRRYKECLNECLKAFESTMKSICDIRGWSYGKNDTAKKLIDVCLSNGLIPLFHAAQLGALRALLESGVPTVRNKLSGHGQGPQPVTVPRYYASYLLHLTAATIKFLIEAEDNSP